MIVPASIVPVSIVTGFLGSGKTTLIGRVLRDRRFARTAVIVNEFGEIGLDHDLIAAAEESLVALTTGCLCCRIRDDLVATLLDLSRRRESGEIAFDRVLIETSGLADPAPILHALLADRDVQRCCAPGPVVTVVDAVNGEASLDRHPEARRQAALADRVLLSKTDIASDTARLRSRLAALNPGAPSVIAAAVAPDTLFADAADQDALAERLATLPASRAPDPFARGLHTDAIETFVLERERAIPALALTLLLQALASHCGARLLRVKGLVDVAEMPGRPALIQGVGHVFATPEWRTAWPRRPRTQLVFITQGVPRHFPSRLLDAIEEEVREENLRSASRSNSCAVP